MWQVKIHLTKNWSLLQQNLTRSSYFISEERHSRLMLLHKTGKLTVFSVELQNADPVLDFLWKHFTSGRPVIYNSLKSSTLMLSCISIFKLEIEVDGHKYLCVRACMCVNLSFPSQNSGFWIFFKLICFNPTSGLNFVFFVLRSE